jgi:hypothetical protein
VDSVATAGVGATAKIASSVGFVDKVVVTSLEIPTDGWPGGAFLSFLLRAACDERIPLL